MDSQIDDKQRISFAKELLKSYKDPNRKKKLLQNITKADFRQKNRIKAALEGMAIAFPEYKQYTRSINNLLNAPVIDIPDKIKKGRAFDLFLRNFIRRGGEQRVYRLSTPEGEQAVQVLLAKERPLEQRTPAKTSLDEHGKEVKAPEITAQESIIKTPSTKLPHPIVLNLQASAYQEALDLTEQGAKKERPSYKILRRLRLARDSSKSLKILIRLLSLVSNQNKAEIKQVYQNPTRENINALVERINAHPDEYGISKLKAAVQSNDYSRLGLSDQAAKELQRIEKFEHLSVFRRAQAEDAYLKEVDNHPDFTQPLPEPGTSIQTPGLGQITTRMSPISPTGTFQAAPQTPQAPSVISGISPVPIPLRPEQIKAVTPSRAGIVPSLLFARLFGSNAATFVKGKLLDLQVPLHKLLNKIPYTIVIPAVTGALVGYQVGGPPMAVAGAIAGGIGGRTLIHPLVGESPFETPRYIGRSQPTEFDSRMGNTGGQNARRGRLRKKAQDAVEKFLLRRAGFSLFGLSLSVLLPILLIAGFALIPILFFNKILNLYPPDAISNPTGSSLENILVEKTGEKEVPNPKIEVDTAGKITKIISQPDINYVITVTNKGTNKVEIELLDNIPDKTTFKSTDWEYNLTTNQVKWKKFSLNAGEVKTLSLVVTVNADVKDTWVVNNGAKGTGTGTGGAGTTAGNLEIKKTGPGECIEDCKVDDNTQPLVYTITVTYKGTGTAESTITDELPPKTRFKEAPEGKYDDTTKIVSWPPLTLKAGETKTLSLTLEALENNIWVVNQAGGEITKTSGGSSASELLPDSLQPVTSRLLALKDAVFNAINRNLEVYKEASDITGVPWEVLAGIHYVEGGAGPNKSLVSGRDIGANEPDVVRGGGCSSADSGPGKPYPLPEGGCGFKTLLDTAIYAGNHLKEKVGGDLTSFEELVKALAGYNGWGNTNCGQSPYNNCPPAFKGDDHPHPMNLFDQKHDPMYIIYCADLTRCAVPPVAQNPGVMAIVRLITEQ